MNSYFKLRTRGKDGAVQVFDVPSDDVNAAIEVIEEYAQSRASAAEEEAKEVRKILVSEMVRIKKLSGVECDPAEETEYLMGLPPNRLLAEMKRLPGAETLRMRSVSENAQEQDEDPYKNARI